MDGGGLQKALKFQRSLPRAPCTVYGWLYMQISTLLCANVTGGVSLRRAERECNCSRWLSARYSNNVMILEMFTLLQIRSAISILLLPVNRFYSVWQVFSLSFYLIFNLVNHSFQIKNVYCSRGLGRCQGQLQNCSEKTRGFTCIIFSFSSAPV